MKPIGMFYTKQEADRMEKEQGFAFAEDAGRGYRRVVASPNPVSIVEVPVIQQLVRGVVKKYCNYSWRRRYTCDRDRYRLSRDCRL